MSARSPQAGVGRIVSGRGKAVNNDAVEISLSTVVNVKCAIAALFAAGDKDQRLHRIAGGALEIGKSGSAVERGDLVVDEVGIRDIGSVLRSARSGAQEFPGRRNCINIPANGAVVDVNQTRKRSAGEIAALGRDAR